MQNTINSGSQVYRRLLTYAIPYWKIFTVAVIAMAVTAITEPVFAAMMGPLIDRGFVHRDPAIIKWLPAAIVILFIIRGSFEFTARFCMTWISRLVIKEVRHNMFQKLILSPMAFYDKTPPGQLVAKFSYDVEQLGQATSNAVTIIVKDTLIVTGLLIWMFVLNWKLALVFVTVGPPAAGLIAFLNKKLRYQTTRIQRSMGEVTHTVDQVIKGHHIVKSYGGQPYESERFNKVNEKNRRFFMRLTMTSVASVPVIQLLAACALAAIIYLATSESATFSAGGFTSFMTTMLLLMPPIKRLTTVNVTIQKGIAAAASVFMILDSEQEKDQGTHSVERANGEVRFDNVRFAYESRPNSIVLDGFSLHIQPGQTVALVGRSGSGKSTVVKLLGRFYDIDHGTITLDGVDIEKYRLKNLREQLAFVSQDVVLFNDTIANNIAYGLPAADSQKIREAARAAHAMEFIERLPDGLQTIISENSLSGGQRQRLAIARAMLKNASVLILDEATSALDSESEHWVQEGLAALMRSCTTIVIAHRLSTIESADRIVLMDAGKIMDSGKHEELLARSRHYNNLYQHRFEDSATS